METSSTVWIVPLCRCGHVRGNHDQYEGRCVMTAPAPAGDSFFVACNCFHFVPEDFKLYEDAA
ncbi:MAG TPA: hypothetical protein VFG76_11635 [Candidatus Polarisedimenticolia bacterium]|nr:hypothetical protein [Candidatus Polarisedimenticolia bacterium]